MQVSFSRTIGQADPARIIILRRQVAGNLDPDQVNVSDGTTGSTNSGHRLHIGSACLLTGHAGPGGIPSVGLLQPVGESGAGLVAAASLCMEGRATATPRYPPGFTCSMCHLILDDHRIFNSGAGLLRNRHRPDRSR